MTSPDLARRTAVLLALSAVGLVGCAGCTLGQSSSFTGRAEATCAQTLHEVDEPTPTQPVQRMAYAMDRYTDVERTVSEIASDISFPGGARGAALRRDWIEPARQSLRTGRTELAVLRETLKSGRATTQRQAFDAAITAGTQGVNTAILRAQRLPTCAQLFGAALPAD